MTRQRLRIAATVCMLFSIAFAAIGQSEGGLRRYALFIGSNDGGPNRVRLAYAATDAIGLAQVMNEMGGVNESDTVLLTDPDPAAVLRSFNQIRQSIELGKSGSRRVEFLLYYSGHADETGILLGGDRLDYRRLRDNVINPE